MELEIFDKIKEAFGTSTPSDNKFKKAIQSIKWESKFFADDEHYFCFGGFVFSTPSLDPFNMKYRPSAIFSDGSFIEV